MTVIAICITRIASFFLRLLNRGGSLPGSIGLKVCPMLLQRLHITCPVILVSGTNGKTSTSNMIASVFENAGKVVISNRKGDNLRAGITTTLATHATLRGRLKAEMIILEVDELNIPSIVSSLPISTIVITNFFRDQLDRAREMEQLIVKIESAIQNFKGTLVLNGNDPNVVRLKDVALESQVLFYGVHACSSSTTKTNEASEGKFCPRCDARILYDFYQYSHIGNYHCSSCDFKTPELDCVGNVVDLQLHAFTYRDIPFYAPQSGLYAIYNCMAVLCVAQFYHIDQKYVQHTFKTCTVPEGRNEVFVCNEQTCVLNLVKNPTGANEVMKVIEMDRDLKTLLFTLNDNPQDGTDISWIYDTCFEKLLTDRTDHIICSGTRAYDMALRLKYGGYNKDIEIQEQLKDAVDALIHANTTMYVIVTYTALQPVRSLLRREVK